VPVKCVTEFLQEVSQLKKNKDKVEALKANDSKVLRLVLQGAFDPKVKWALPEGKPPYKPSILHDQEHQLVQLANKDKFLYYIEGFYPNLRSTKREQMFIELLEILDPRDAELVCSIKDKKMPFTGISINIVKEAFPDLINE